MPLRRLHLPGTNGAELRAGFALIRDELGVPADFDAAVLADAEAAARAPHLPGRDLTHIPFATLDPPGSRDLDQAYAIERTGSGFRVRYAIADVAAFVAAGSKLDLAAHARVETLYLPDGRVPLYPSVLSEGAASLLPGQARPALVWTLDLDPGGRLVGTDVHRAVVRSREQQAYPDVQRALDEGTASEPLRLLREVGTLRQQLQRDRGGMNLAVPSQDIVPAGQGWTLQFRGALQVEDWNAQVSLLTGMAAAQLMLDGGVGVLRTMPPADPHDVARLRRVARGLHIDWPLTDDYGVLLGRLGAPGGPEAGHVAAFLTEATSLFRGAAYAAFDGHPPSQPLHAAIAAPYAHCTAPLRRLVDRYVGEVAVALCAAKRVPSWAREALPALPQEMAAGERRAHQVEHAAVDLVEAAVLSRCVGAQFEGLVVDIDERRGGGSVQIAEPAVLARCEATHGPLRIGEPIQVRVLEADISRRTVRFVPV